MKKLLLFVFLMMSYMGYAQSLPYGQFLKYSDKDFKEAKFKYNGDTNTWTLRRAEGLRATANVLSAFLGATDDVRPGVKDYIIEVRMGENELIAAIDVVFYDDQTYHKLMTFAKDNGQNLLETTSGKLKKCQFNYDGYSILLQTREVGLSAVSSRTIVDAAKVVDESYSVYHYVIETGVKPWSEYLERQQRKEAKRDAKGKKKRDVESLM